jgi:hypothetical protein
MDRTNQSQKYFVNDNYIIPALTTYEYGGYIIAGWARPESMNRLTSIAIVYRRDEFGAIIRVQRIVGELFDSKEQAEQHGVELCKGWIDKQISLADSNKIKQSA